MSIPREGWIRTGVAIRTWLLETGQGSPWDFYRRLKDQRVLQDLKAPTYDHVRRYFWILKKMGLITRIGEVPSKYQGRAKALYVITPGTETDDRWNHPQTEFYPSTKWGRRRYLRKAIRGGRNPFYRGR